MSGGCLDGVCECLTVSGSYLRVSGRCLGEYRCHKQLDRGSHIELLPFLPVTSLGQKVLNFGVSVGCLEGVWRVSEGVWRVSGGVLRVSGGCNRNI